MMTEVWRITGDSLLVAGSKPPKTKFRSDLEKLEKKAEDTWATYEDAVIAFGNAEDDDDYAEDIICDTAYRAYADAIDELDEYLKDQDDD